VLLFLSVELASWMPARLRGLYVSDRYLPAVPRILEEESIGLRDRTQFLKTGQSAVSSYSHDERFRVKLERYER